MNNTTDISELVQMIKAAAVRAKTATEEYASGHMSASVCYAECEEFNRLTDGPDNILALTAALEKAQEVDEELCRLLPGCEYMDPPDGGSVSPLEQVKRMIADYRRRIAELEARTVKLPPTFWYEHDDLSQDIPVLDKRLVKKMLKDAGIKWESE